jgi:hypothetical protein
MAMGMYLLRVDYHNKPNGRLQNSPLINGEIFIRAFVPLLGSQTNGLNISGRVACSTPSPATRKLLKPTPAKTSIASANLMKESAPSR